MNGATAAADAMRAELDAFREAYELLLNEDKGMEKAARKETADSPCVLPCLIVFVWCVFCVCALFVCLCLCVCFVCVLCVLCVSASVSACLSVPLSAYQEQADECIISLLQR